MMGLPPNAYGRWKRRQSAPIWDPGSIGGGVFWGRMDTVTLGGSDIQTLTDKRAGGTNHLDAAGAGNRPLWVATGFNGGSQPYGEFDGAAEWLRKLAFAFGGSPAALTLWMVYQDITMVAGDRVVAYGVSPVEVEVRQQAAGPQYVSHFDSFVMGAVMTTARLTTFTSSGTHIRGYVGNTLTSGPVASTIVPVDNDTFAVGATPGGVALASIRLAEVGVCLGAISAPDLALLSAYATARYGV